MIGGREMDLVKDLNEEQREAVIHEEGPLLVLAGAGSGKTRVLTCRFAHLVGVRRVSPSRILAVTFTNKAAGEMKERIGSLIGALPYRLWVGTFHSIGVRILRRTGSFIGVDRNFTIFDGDDQKRLVKTICREQGLDPAAERIERTLSHIRRRKARLSSPEKMDGERETEESFLFSFYESGLRRMNALDFDDLLARPVLLFRERPDILEEYAGRFEHVLVDEFQDTNRIQNELVRLLQSKHKNICAVGDDDQSIYRWRGADVGNILRFERSFPGARVVRLERNYRSTASILEAAHAVIRNNRDRRGKKLWTDRKGGALVGLARYRSERDEAYGIAREIRKGIDTGPERAGDFAVFYRTNAQSRAIEEGCRSLALPYVIIGGTRFYERREVKDVLAYLRLFQNRRDEISFGRVLNVPARGIGNRTRERLTRHALGRNLSLLESAGEADEIDGLGRRPRELLLRFHELVERYAARVSEERPQRIVRDLVEELRIVEILEEKEGEKGALRGENVKEFVSAVADFEERRPEALLDEFLAEVSLLTDVDSLKEGPDTVTLMTLHNSKGLEFDRVFIAGVEEGLLPHLLSTMEDEEVEEERRLFYVGITRARDKVTLSHTTTRLRYGEIAPASPSRFLDEIPETLIEEITPRSRVERATGRNAGDKEDRADEFPDYEGESQERANFRTGDRIRHDTWGEGRVTAIEGSGEATKLSVFFLRGFTKIIMVRFASLEWIGRPT